MPAAFLVANVANGEFLRRKGIRLQVPGVGLHFAVAGLPTQLADAVLDVAPAARQFLGKANGRAGNGLAAARVGVFAGCRQSWAAARVHDLAVGQRLVAREALGQQKLALCFGDGAALLDVHRALVDVLRHALGGEGVDVVHRCSFAQ
ncbi:hypothetical protein D9M72_575300 [compost metagenome]